MRRATGNVSLDLLDPSPQEASSDDDAAPCSKFQHIALRSVSFGMSRRSLNLRPVEPGAATTAIEKKRLFLALVVCTVQLP